MRFVLVRSMFLFTCWLLGDPCVAQMAIPNPPQRLSPGVQEAIDSLRDLLGEEAMALEQGPSYEFFENLLPPPRYVHADFRFYPLVLAAPRNPVKARIISNGSGVNLRGGSKSWKDEGIPIAFRVGPDEFRFGGLVDRVSNPMLREGWLPIYEIQYQHAYPVQSEGMVPIDQKPQTRPPEIYRQEFFVTTDPNLADHAIVYVRFSLAQGAQGTVTVQWDPPTDRVPEGNYWFDDHGDVVIAMDTQWKPLKRSIQAKLTPNQSATLAIATRPISKEKLSWNDAAFEHHRALTESTWREIISQAMQVNIPEPRVQNAWKNLLVQNWMILQNDKMFYSADNQYEQLYVAEGGDAVRAMAWWGYRDLAQKCFLPILRYSRKGLENHQAGLKLQDLAVLYYLHRDHPWLIQISPEWTQELERLMGPRNEQGLLPKERYCGDISTPVHSLSVEGKGWRALHDWVPILRTLDQSALADRVQAYETTLRPQLVRHIQASIHRATDPPFIPIALRDREEPHSPITATRIGSYWNLLSNFVIGSRLFDPQSPEEEWLPHYLENHGGLFMGMTRAGGTAHGFWTESERVNPLYGTRYVLDTLRRDDADRALVSFYGMLAQGMTRNTFIAGEGSTLQPVDEHGRFFYCPPNTAGNAHFLSMLRHLLIQDIDANNDGQPETLRLLFGTSRRWLEHGKVLAIEKAPTAFGPVSLRVESQLEKGLLIIDGTLPKRNETERTELKLRLPKPWKMHHALLNDKELSLHSEEGLDLSGQEGEFSIRVMAHRR